MNRMYELECSVCEEFTRVGIEDDDTFPTYCPLCGGEAEATLDDLEL